MTNEQINRAVAEELGWRPVPNSSRLWYRPGETIGVEAAFTDDHNAAAEIRRAIKPEDEILFAHSLEVALGAYCDGFDLINATPRQQAEAFLRMRGKWLE